MLLFFSLLFVNFVVFNVRDMLIYCQLCGIIYPSNTPDCDSTTGVACKILIKERIE